MITKKEKISFIDYVISDFLLEIAIQWINQNLKPEEVFDEDTLNEWAYKNGFEEKD